jgi:phage baseplate assembly protein W
MSYEPQIFEIPCDCVDSPRDLLVLPVCQICNGTEKKVDWSFGTDNELMVVTGISKLQQDILKIMLTWLGSNELYTDYGSDIDKSIGQKNLGTHTQLKIQSDVINALNYLKNQQQQLQEKYGNLDPEEAIDSIQSVIVEPVSNTAYVVLVTFTTVASATSSVATTIGSPVDKALSQEAISRLLKT